MSELEKWLLTKPNGDGYEPRQCAREGALHLLKVAKEWFKNEGERGYDMYPAAKELLEHLKSYCGVKE